VTLIEIPDILTKSNANLKWFIDNHEMLLDKYQEKFVAIDDGQIIDSNTDIKELMDKLKQSNRYYDSTLIQYINNRNTKLTV
jgi:Family of unknown function (DUF5678)